MQKHLHLLLGRDSVALVGLDHHLEAFLSHDVFLLCGPRVWPVFVRAHYRPTGLKKGQPRGHPPFDLVPEALSDVRAAALNDLFTTCEDAWVDDVALFVCLDVGVLFTGLEAREVELVLL